MHLLLTCILALCTKASNALFVKNGPLYFLIIADLIIFITDNTLLYYKPLVGDFVAKIVIPTERSDEGSLKLHVKEISPHCNRRNDNMPGGIQCITLLYNNTNHKYLL